MTKMASQEKGKSKYVYARCSAPLLAFAARSPRSQGRIVKPRANKSDREVHDKRCKLTTCNCKDFHAAGKQPRRRVHVRDTHVKDAEQEQYSITR